MSYYSTYEQESSALVEESQDEWLFSNKTSSNGQETRTRFPINKRIIRGRRYWNRDENSRYLAFLKKNFDLFHRTRQQKRILRIYGMMAGEIGTKNYAQCRMHHHKMTSRYGDLEAIIEACERKQRGVFGTIDKMQEYGLRVDLSEDSEQVIVQEKNIWGCVEDQCWSYYQNEGSPQSLSLF